MEQRKRIKGLKIERCKANKDREGRVGRDGDGEIKK